MTLEQEKQIKKIKDETECPFDFGCLKIKFAQHYKILKNRRSKHYLETSERPPPTKCRYSVSFGDSYLCFCPLALYVIRNKIEF